VQDFVLNGWQGFGFIFAGVQVSVYPAWEQDFVLHGCRFLWWWWAVKYSLQYPAWVQDLFLQGCRIYFCRGAGFWVSVWVVTIISCMGAGFRFAWVQVFVVVVVLGR
jgi:hypothetical protein